MRVFTKDDATVAALARAGLRDALAWRDRLTFGPLSATAGEEAFFEMRASVFEDAGWDEYRIAAADFALWSDGAREAWETGEELTLLFGPSLGEQLKIGWIVDWIARRHATRAEEARLVLLPRDLAEFDGESLLQLVANAAPLGEARADRYRRFWRAAAGEDPSAWASLQADLAEDSSLAILAAAAERWLQEFPSFENGLSLTECQILDAVALGIREPRALFAATQETEAPPFRCDWEFWPILDRLTTGEAPLLRTESGEPFLCPPRALAWNAFDAQRLELTESGQAALRGEFDAAEAGLLPRWLGGLLLDESAAWRYRHSRRALERTPLAPTAAL